MPSVYLEIVQIEDLIEGRTGIQQCLAPLIRLSYFFDDFGNGIRIDTPNAEAALV